MTGKRTVFLVDDDEALRRATVRLLRAAGYGVRAFTSVEDFLDAFDPEQPGCLLLDVRMPGRSGLELQEELARSGSTPPVVFLTGHADAESKSRAMAQGAIGFLQKPCGDDELLELLERALDLDDERRGR
jgi:FixJ family two-component response regulator